MRILHVIFAIMTGMSIAGAAESGDTVRYYYNPHSVTISETADGVSVEVNTERGEKILIENSGEGDRIVKSSMRFNRISTDCCGGWNLISNGLTFGFVATPGSGGSVSPDMGKSLEIGWLNIVGLERRLWNGWNMSIGIGIDWRNYRSTRGLVYHSESGHAVVSDERPEGYRFSRIKIFSLQFPVLWTKTFIARTGFSPAIGFGAILNCNTHGSVKTSWRDERGKKQSESDNNIGQRKFTIDLYGQLSFGDIGLYVRYTPYRMLTGSTSPDYRSLSAGITLFY